MVFNSRQVTLFIQLMWFSVLFLFCFVFVFCFLFFCFFKKLLHENIELNPVHFLRCWLIKTFYIMIFFQFITFIIAICVGIGIGFAIGNSQNETNSNAAGKARRPFKSAMHWGYPQRNSQSQIHNIEFVESIFLIIMIIRENFLTSCNKD